MVSESSTRSGLLSLAANLTIHVHVPHSLFCPPINGGATQKVSAPPASPKMGGHGKLPPQTIENGGAKIPLPPHSTSQMGVQKIEQNRVPPHRIPRMGGHMVIFAPPFLRDGGAHDHFCPPHGVEMEGQKRSISSLRQFCQN